MFNINSHSKTIEDVTQVASGFQMIFANGNTISVQFGCGNYCDNRKQSKMRCLNAEIAIWNSDDKMYVFDNNDVYNGYCSADGVAEYIYLASTLTF